MFIEAGLCYVLYSLGEKIFRNIAMEEPLGEAPDKPTQEDEHIINMVKNDEADAFEKESVSLEPEAPLPDDPEKRYQMYVNSSLASMGLFALKPILGPLGFFPYFFGVIPYANDVKKALVEKKQVNADVLFFAADMLTLASGNLFTAAFGLYLIHSGKLAVARAKDNSQKMVMHLFEELPREVVVIGDQGQEILTPIEAVNKGDIIEVCPGQVVPVDGVITGGMASIDQHALTGESQPSEKGLNDVVLANTIVIAGTILVRVENSGLETTSHQVAQMLFNSVSFKSDVQLKGEEWADKMTLPMLLAAGIVLPTLGLVPTAVLINGHIGVRIRLLGPLGTLKHISLASQEGVLVKDGRALEKLHLVDTILFDKTGTLTTDEPEVVRVITAYQYKEETVLRYAAAAEQNQTHPIARAIVKKAGERQLDPLNIHDSKYKIGYGITVQIEDDLIRVGSDRFLLEEGLSIPRKIKQIQEESHNAGRIFILVGINNQVAGAIELQPTVQKGIKDLVCNLKAHGVDHLAIVSGDHKAPTKQLAKLLGMDDFFYEVLPQNKAKIVEDLQNQGRTVCFVGDGINDSMALKQADVSISLAGATTIAKDMAEIILMDGDISALDKLMTLSEKLDENLKRSLNICLVPSVVNIAGAFFLNFNILTSLLVNVGCNLVGMANVMPPSENLTAEAQLDRDTKSESPDE